MSAIHNEIEDMVYLVEDDGLEGEELDESLRIWFAEGDEDPESFAESLFDYCYDQDWNTDDAYHALMASLRRLYPEIDFEERMTRSEEAASDEEQPQHCIHYPQCACPTLTECKRRQSHLVRGDHDDSHDRLAAEVP